ncbi:thioredoxin domain-containing protein [Clostridium sp. Mt-5]|uniref:Thioredoxin domain-containing protein n=1 Tax=Clostridium moutaii TaxID=3240932 RepID=A0ABV4BIY6_9CLOT
MNPTSTPNRLINEKSPYLLQHAYNPVNWYPWGEEAFTKAREEDKPIFLSIGYSTCHWCHVFSRESFEDKDVSEILNNNFVSIKVDREERPDIDNVYMKACQLLTGSGGWPLTIIMTSDQKPFFAGTYFPKDDIGETLGLTSILKYLSTAWKDSRSQLLQAGNSIMNSIAESNKTPVKGPSRDILEKAFSEFKHNFDNLYGGFGGSPKFPTPHNLLFLLRYFYMTKDDFALEMVEKTLDCMQKGGIYDHIGYGFSRYSVDRKWLVPHFEKMLYDNALLTIAYVEAFQITGNKKYSETAEDILTYILRDMTSKEGGFYSSEDADSEGEEGKFYIWSMKEIKEVLGEENGDKFCHYFNVTPSGNFDGKNILNLINSPIPEGDVQFIKSCRKKLFSHRESRVHPHKDDKILTSWNGLMIAAMSIAGRVLNNKKYTMAAKNAADFIFKKLIGKKGRLLARYRKGESSLSGYLDDYAFLIWGLIELYESTYNPEYLEKALDLNEDLFKFFWDEKNGGFFLYGNDSEQLIIRPKEIYDGALPSGNSAAALNLLRLSHLTTSYEFEDKIRQLFKNFADEVNGFPMAYSFLLCGLLFSKHPTRQIIVSVGDNTEDTKKAVAIINKKYNPFSISLLYSHLNENLVNIIPSIKDYLAIRGKTTVYICENFTCQKPITDINLLEKML